MYLNAVLHKTRIAVLSHNSLHTECVSLKILSRKCDMAMKIEMADHMLPSQL